MSELMVGVMVLCPLRMPKSLYLSALGDQKASELQKTHSGEKQDQFIRFFWFVNILRLSKHNVFNSFAVDANSSTVQLVCNTHRICFFDLGTIQQVNNPPTSNTQHTSLHAHTRTRTTRQNAVRESMCHSVHVQPCMHMQWTESLTPNRQPQFE